MRLRVVLASLAASAVGCTAPNYGNGHLQCAPSDVCPSGFYCAADQHCWQSGSGPPGGDLAAGGDLGSLFDLAGPDLAPSPSKCGGLMGVILCDGFESQTMFSGWGASGTNGSPSRDTSRAYRGAASMHAHITGASAMVGPLAVFRRSDIFPITGTIYARVWVYFTSGLPPSFEQFLNFTDIGTTGYSVATDSGRVTLDDYAGNVYQTSTTLMPLDRWACVQLDVQQGGPASAIHVRVDGQLLADLPPSATTTTAAGVSLGLDFNGNTAAIPPYDAWFDEIIIDNKPTTCDE